MLEARQKDLGGRLRQYKINTAPGAMLALGAIVVYGVVGTPIFILGLLGTVELNNMWFGILMGAPVALLLGLWGAFNLWRQRDNVLQTYERGFTLRQKGKDYAFRWDEIEFVWALLTRYSASGVPVKTTHQYFIKGGGEAEVIKLDNTFENIELIGAQILRETFPHLYRKAEERYESGEEVDFGGLKVGRTGLSFRDKSITWGEIEKIETKDGSIRIRKQGKWLNFLEFDAGSMPNLMVLEALTNKILNKTE